MSTTPSPASLPRTVWALGIVSLCMDLSSELVHSLLPALMTTVLGAGVLALGLIEGVAEATASFLKVYAGALSDRLRRRKPLLIIGYGLAALTRPLFPLAGAASTVFAARVIDRLGKGMRGAPRDALIADVTPPGLRGTAYGLRQALDSVGALLGPMCAVVLMLAFDGDLRTVLWFALLPAVAAVLVLIVAVREPAVPAPAQAPGPVLTPRSLRGFGAHYWLVLGLAALFTLARFSEAFLVLRAMDLGLAIAWAPAVMVLMSLVYALSAYPAGIAADRGAQHALLVWGLLVLILADLLLASADGLPALLAGTALWGLHMGLTQGLLTALVAAAAPAERRGTAFGIFHLVTGISLLAASTLAGALWAAWGAAWTFNAGAIFALMALLGLILHRRFRTDVLVR